MGLGPLKSPLTLNDFIVHYLDLISPHSSQVMLMQMNFSSCRLIYCFLRCQWSRGECGLLNPAKRRERKGIKGRTSWVDNVEKVSDTQRVRNGRVLQPTHKDYFNCALIRRDTVISPISELCHVRTHKIVTELDFTRRNFTWVVFLKAEDGATGLTLCFHKESFVS